MKTNNTVLVDDQLAGYETLLAENDKLRVMVQRMREMRNAWLSGQQTAGSVAEELNKLFKDDP